MARPADPHAKVDLLAAAERVFVRHGLDLAKVEEITALAGHSKGAFYLHFSSKEDAFKQIVESFLARLHGIVREHEEMYTQDVGMAGAQMVLDAWLTKITELFDFLWVNRGVVRLVFEGGRSAAFGYLIDDFAERNCDNMRGILEWGVRQGFYRPDLDLEVASHMLAGGYDRMAREVVKKDVKPNLPRLCAEMQRFMCMGLATPQFAELIDHKVRNLVTDGSIGESR
jgi:AcrR family transcriptional regulator